MSNLIPDRYREVSVTAVDFTLTSASIERFLLGREVYRRTRFVVLRHGASTALAAVGRDAAEPLFAPVAEVAVLALPDRTAWVDAAEVDTGVPSQLTRVATERAPGVDCVVVAGRHGHVSFVLEPAPVRVTVVDVAPPYPAKLVDQVRSILDVADDLPPVELVPQVTDLAELAAIRPAARYLLPCRGSGLVLGTETAYLDERPPAADWVLVGCARSREIHRWFYGRDAPGVDMCPRRLAEAAGAVSTDAADGPSAAGGTHAADGPSAVGGSDALTLTKCCLLEEEKFDRSGGFAVVPWGASLTLIRAALADLVRSREVAWSRG
ncbi:MAG TPA: hypothetical protein VKG85_10065 [Actinomycetes bacterium]|nr:hypothetical protein [Actinomycetes bacterium]